MKALEAHSAYIYRKSLLSVCGSSLTDFIHTTISTSSAAIHAPGSAKKSAFSQKKRVKKTAAETLAKNSITPETKGANVFPSP